MPTFWRRLPPRSSPLVCCHTRALTRGSVGITSHIGSRGLAHGVNVVNVLFLDPWFRRYNQSYWFLGSETLHVFLGASRFFFSSMVQHVTLPPAGLAVDDGRLLVLSAQSSRADVIVFAGLQPAQCHGVCRTPTGTMSSLGRVSSWFTFLLLMFHRIFFSACSSRKPTEECHYAGTQPHGHSASSNVDGCSACSRFASVLHCYVNCSHSVCCWFFLDLGSRLGFIAQ